MHCPVSRWLVRSPLVLVATSELVKLRFVVVQQSQAEAPDAFGYFFWLYCAFVALQVGPALRQHSVLGKRLVCCSLSNRVSGVLTVAKLATSSRDSYTMETADALLVCAACCCRRTSRLCCCSGTGMTMACSWSRRVCIRTWWVVRSAAPLSEQRTCGRAAGWQGCLLSQSGSPQLRAQQRAVFNMMGLSPGSERLGAVVGQCGITCVHSTCADTPTALCVTLLVA